MIAAQELLADSLQARLDRSLARLKPTARETRFYRRDPEELADDPGHAPLQEGPSPTRLGENSFTGEAVRKEYAKSRAICQSVGKIPLSGLPRKVRVDPD